MPKSINIKNEKRIINKQHPKPTEKPKLEILGKRMKSKESYMKFLAILNVIKNYNGEFTSYDITKEFFKSIGTPVEEIRWRDFADIYKKARQLMKLLLKNKIIIKVYKPKDRRKTYLFIKKYKNIV